MSDVGIAVDADVFLRFEHTGRFTNDEMWIDDVRIGNADLLGPRITGVDPAGLTTAPLTSIIVPFDSVVDPATFTADDVVLVSPIGEPIQILGDPTTTDGGQTYRIEIEPQSLGGTYRLVIGPQTCWTSRAIP